MQNIADPKWFHSFETHQQPGGTWVASACMTHTWDIYVGEGATEADAITNARVVVNAYDKTFRQVARSYGIPLSN